MSKLVWLNKFRRDWYIYVALLIILFGIVIRLVHLLYIDMAFPFRGGGLFLEFAKQIIENGYYLPSIIPNYTENGVPFAYPPIPFYLEAILIDVLRIPDFTVVNILPAVAAALTVPAFYWLTVELKFSKIARLIALIIYASMPIAFWELLEGSGLAEAFGTLTIICFLAALVRALNSRKVTNYLLAAVFWALCIASGPGSAFASVPTFLLFVSYIILSNWPPDKRKIGLIIFLGLSALILSAPYWLTVVNRYGISFFLEAISGQESSRSVREDIVRVLFRFDLFSGWAAFWYLAATASGFIWTFATGRWDLWVWLLIMAFIPREGAWLLSIPASLLAGIGIADWIGPTAIAQAKRNLIGWRYGVFAFGASALIIVIVIYSPFRAIRDLTYVHPTVDAGTITATEWANINTPVDAEFIIIASSFVDDWIPYLLQRNVLNVYQGTEWQPTEFHRWEKLQAGLGNCTDYECVQAQVCKIMDQCDIYVFADRSIVDDHFAAPTKSSNTVLRDILWESDNYIISHLSLLQ